MTTVYRYRVYCETDEKYEYIWGTTEPTTCPTNTAHPITQSFTNIVEKISSEEVSIKEETIPTGGNFQTTTMTIDASANTTTIGQWWFPIPISTLAVAMVTSATHQGDMVSLTIGEDTTIGAITNFTTSATTWISQDYTQGDIVLYTPSGPYGERVYTCIKNTTSSQAPTDRNYWVHGTEISVSTTVIQNTKLGYYLKLFDGLQAFDCGKVLFIDTLNSKVYVENDITLSFSPASPTYVLQTVYMFKDADLGEPWLHDIGRSKIGGSYIPANTVVTVHYKNNSNFSKKVVGRVEYLY